MKRERETEGSCDSCSAAYNTSSSYWKCDKKIPCFQCIVQGRTCIYSSDHRRTVSVHDQNGTFVPQNDLKNSRKRSKNDPEVSSINTQKYRLRDRGRRVTSYENLDDRIECCSSDEGEERSWCSPKVSASFSSSGSSSTSSSASGSSSARTKRIVPDRKYAWKSRVKVACDNCRQSHTKCDNDIPCFQCSQRNLRCAYKHSASSKLSKCNPHDFLTNDSKPLKKKSKNGYPYCPFTLVKGGRDDVQFGIPVGEDDVQLGIPVPGYVIVEAPRSELTEIDQPVITNTMQQEKRIVLYVNNDNF